MEALFFEYSTKLTNFYNGCSTTSAIEQSKHEAEKKARRSHKRRAENNETASDLHSPVKTQVVTPPELVVGVVREAEYRRFAVEDILDVEANGPG